MRKKVVIVVANRRVWEKFEEILSIIAEEGGELFFADKKEDGLTLIARENPQIVFLDLSLKGGDEALWKKEGVHLIIMDKRFKVPQILEMCRSVLGREVASPLPPM